MKFTEPENSAPTGYGEVNERLRGMIYVVASTVLSVSILVSTLNAQPQSTLRSTFQKYFLVGAALNQAQYSGSDEKGAALAVAQFNTITPENDLKWERVHPALDVYAFDAPDRFVEFGEKHGMIMIGHTLLWHNQTPRWVFEDSTGKIVDRETLLKRLHIHIQTVVGRYKGRIKGWDVVNEALNEDGTLRQTAWMKIIGEDYLVKAYEFAHEADPNAELYYNDYSLENAPKREGAIALVKKLQSQGVHVAAVGTQGHYKMNWPSMEQVESTIVEFAKLGVKVNFTELDIDVVPATQRNEGGDVALNSQKQARADMFAKGLPDSVQQALTRRYADLFTVFVKHADVVDRVTFWGVTDGDSWLNSGGRVNYPLLFDRNHEPKPAFFAVIKTGRN